MVGDVEWFCLVAMFLAVLVFAAYLTVNYGKPDR